VAAAKRGEEGERGVSGDWMRRACVV
jgi:hypothetical protein